MNISSTTRSWYPPMIVGFLLYLTLGCAEAPVSPTLPGPPQSVSVAYPVSRPVVETLRYTGRLQAAQRVEVRARVKGYLNRVLFQEGTEVPQGMALYEIDPRGFQAAADQAKAEVAKLEVEHRIASLDADRSSRLQTQGVVTAEEHDHRLAAKAIAGAALAQGRARLDATLLDLSFTRVSAPIHGRVGRTLVTIGNLVGQSEPTLLTTIVQMDPLHLVFEVTERDLLAYWDYFGQSAESAANSPALKVRFGLDADEGTPREAVVDFRDTEVNTSNGTLLLRAVVSNPDRLMTPGMYARVEVSVPRAESSLHVPETALAADQQGRYVFVVDAEGKVQRRSVKISVESNGLIAIESGLGASDKVIVAGQAKVQTGTPVAAEVVNLQRLLVAQGDLP